MRTLEEYEKRLIEMQDIIAEKVFQKMIENSVTDPHISQALIDQHFNSYVEYINSTSEKDTVRRIKDLIRSGSTHEVPAVLLNTNDGMKIVKQCLDTIIEEFEPKYKGLFSNFDRGPSPNVLKYIQEDISSFVNMIVVLKEKSHIESIIDQQQAKKVYHAFSSVMENFTSREKQFLDQKDEKTRYWPINGDQLIEKVLSSLPLPKHFLQNELENISQNTGAENTNPVLKEKKFSI